MKDEKLIDALVDGVVEFNKAFKNEDMREGIERYLSIDDEKTIEMTFYRFFFAKDLDAYSYPVVDMCMEKIGINTEIREKLGEIFAVEYGKYIVNVGKHHNRTVFARTVHRVTGHMDDAVNSLKKIDSELYYDPTFAKYSDEIEQLKADIRNLRNRIEEENPYDCLREIDE